ncbi:hypothetical protein V493_08194 [Pseudogymnoascus sp. VKM F-4281 (FW-2241)]|nr:hypothetical protein V493_08194 [Pseudogymnoascus sp. VKM F-4281 (FW-2241)]
MKSALSLAATLVVALLPIASANTITCYGYDGKPWANNVLCPGSQTCCGEHGVCQGNKLCNSQSNGQGEVIRGPCALKKYDPKLCGEICLYDEVNERFPRVTICKDDGKYCCDNDESCCAKGKGVVLNGLGNVVGKAEPDPSSTSMDPSQISTTDPSPSTTSPIIPTAVSETTAPFQSTTSPEPTAAGGLATGAKIGIGVGVPVGVLAAAGLAAFLWFRRRRRVYSANTGYKAPAQELETKGSPQEMPGFRNDQNNVPIELPAGEAAGMTPAKVDYKPYVRSA